MMDSTWPVVWVERLALSCGQMLPAGDGRIVMWTPKDRPWSEYILIVECNVIFDTRDFITDRI